VISSAEPVTPPISLASSLRVSNLTMPRSQGTFGSALGLRALSGRARAAGRILTSRASDGSSVGPAGRGLRGGCSGARGWSMCRPSTPSVRRSSEFPSCILSTAPLMGPELRRARAPHADPLRAITRGGVGVVVGLSVERDTRSACGRTTAPRTSRSGAAPSCCYTATPDAIIAATLKEKRRCRDLVLLSIVSQGKSLRLRSAAANTIANVNTHGKRERKRVKSRPKNEDPFETIII